MPILIFLSTLASTFSLAVNSWTECVCSFLAYLKQLITLGKYKYCLDTTQVENDRI